jgi:superfamily II helicase
MHANPKRRKPDANDVVERAILALVVAVYPLSRTLLEVSREIGNREMAERAVRKLSDYGLIRLHGQTLLLTDAAFHCHRLDAW